MRRRDLILGIGAALAAPTPARAKRSAMRVIGLLSTTSPGTHGGSLRAALLRGLSETGYSEGRNLTIETRQAGGRYERLPVLAADLVRRKVDLIVTGGTPGAPAAKAATSTIPIVFMSGEDPVANRLVASLAKPGGNLTGVYILADELVSKRVELLYELIDPASAIAVLVNPTRANAELVLMTMRRAAQAKGLHVHVLKAGSDEEIAAAFASVADLRADAVVVAGDPFFNARQERLVMLAARHAVPVIYGEREFADAGGLISYGPSLTAIFYQLGLYVGRILNGEKPADLPVQQPTKFELVINLKTAEALGLAVPQSLLARADEVIE